MNKRYAVSDLHGQLQLYKQIKDYIDDTDVVYALGDFGDRGPEPWRTLKAALDDPQFVYIMGNHDLLLIQAIEEYLKIQETDGVFPINPNAAINTLIANGGGGTLFQWEVEPDKIKYYNQLKFLPLEIRLAAQDGKHIISLTHAGYTPGEDKLTTVFNFVWNRSHIFDDWDNIYSSIIIHGHTPVSFMEKSLNVKFLRKKDGYCVYGKGDKINIDLGSFVTNETVLLDIDTLEGKIFKC